MIPNEDEDIAKKFTEVFAKKYNVHLGYKMESVSKNSTNDDGVEEPTTHLMAKNKSGQLLEMDTAQLIVSAGRVLNTPILNLDKTGVKVN